MFYVAIPYENLELVHLDWSSPRQRILNNRNRTTGRRFLTGYFYTAIISQRVCCYWTR